MRLTPTRRFAIAIGGIMLLVAIGTTGYILIADMSFIDALYMSVITISTVGFEEVKPLGPGGRIFTMFLIVTGVGTALYLFTVAAELVVEGQLREFLGTTSMQRKIHQLRDHIIVCGYGRFGRAVTEELRRDDLPVVVIDPNPGLEAELIRAGLLFIVASALEDAILEEAGVQSARAIVVATGSDADNVYITLSAREKNPTIKIHARGETEAGMRRLRLAGADSVVSSYQHGGMRVAAMILRPAVVDFLELAVPGRGSHIDLEEVEVVEGSSAVGKTIESVERSVERLRVVALQRGDEPITMVPEAAAVIRAGDRLVVIGDRTSLGRVADILNR